MPKVKASVPDAALTSKCQATIPKAVRDHMKIGPGDRIRFFLGPHGRVGVLPVRSVSESEGLLRSIRSKVRRPRTLEEIERGTMEGATVKFRKRG